jgi:hypothetical protein
MEKLDWENEKRKESQKRDTTSRQIRTKATWQMINRWLEIAKLLSDRLWDNRNKATYSQYIGINSVGNSKKYWIWWQFMIKIQCMFTCIGCICLVFRYTHFRKKKVGCKVRNGFQVYLWYVNKFYSRLFCCGSCVLAIFSNKNTCLDANTNEECRQKFDNRS